MFGKAIQTAAQAVKKAAPKLQQAKQMDTAQRTAAAKKAVNTGPRTPPPSANVNPIRPRGVMGTKPLNAQGVTAATPSRPKGGIGMTGGPKPSMPATNTNIGRRLTGGAPPSSANVNPIRPGMRGAGATQSGREQAMQGAAATMNTFKDYKDAQAGRVGAGAQKAFGAKKGGKVSSKMGAVKTSAKPDGIAKKGKTKGRMV